MKKFFEALEGASLMAVCIVLSPLLRPWYSGWGCTEEETRMKLPGDELVPEPRGGYTQAIGINAPAASVWPWVAQTGQGKGGFYSYELLENIVGCDIHNIERVLPEFQDVKPGDGMILHPKIPALSIVIVDYGRTLVAEGKVDDTNSNNWIFHVVGEGGSSRLISRWTFQYEPKLLNRILYNGFIEPIASVMQRKQLKTIKRLAETKGLSRA